MPPLAQIKDSNLYQAYTISVEAVRYLRPLTHKIIYLESDQLDRLKVKTTEINLDSGIPKDEGIKVLELKPLDYINAIAREKDLINQNPISAGGKYSPGNWHSGRHFGTSLMEFFSQTPNLSNDTLLELSPWEETEEKTDERFDPWKIHWRVEFALHTKDKSIPDIVCFISNDAPIEHDKFFFNEIWCISRMGAKRLRDKIREKVQDQEHDYEIAPVTVVTSSGRDVRIVQGYADGGKGCVFVRKTNIITFDNDDVQDELRIVKIICWMLGTPCRGTAKLY